MFVRPTFFLDLPDRPLLVVGVLLCVIAAWFTIGYHHPDEHFQIWEFANYKLGHIPASALPWEFPAEMRPGLQPFLAYSIVIFARFFGIQDPFVYVFLARLTCTSAALWVYWEWTVWLARDFKNQHSLRWMRLGLLFFWLMPYLNVRFSSENTSAIAFFGGVLLLVQNLALTHPKLNGKLVLAGLLLGLSFFFRYQIAFAGIGLGAWLLFQRNMGIARWAALVLGVGLAVAVGAATDFWLYDEWVFAPYNYFFSNIMEGKAANFGVAPFYWYLTEMPIALLPPLSIILLFGVGLGVWHQPKHVFTWISVPFVLAHALVAHKEIRFLFPMVLPFFFFACAGWEAYRGTLATRKWVQKLWYFCLILNGLVLLIRIFLPAKEMASYARFLYKWEESHPDTKVFFVKKKPIPNYPLNMPFYKHPSQKQIDWYTEPPYQNDTSALNSGDLMFFTDACLSGLIPLKGFHLIREFTYYPDWILINNTNNWQDRTRIWSIYRLE